MIRKIVRNILKFLKLEQTIQSLYLGYLRFKLSAGLKFMSLFAWSGFLSSAYYTFFSRKFDREHRSVMKGMLQNFKASKEGKLYSYQLIRYVHALEKGLSMKKRRDVFALDYIQEAISIYENLLSMGDRSPFSRDQLTWADNIFTAYFEVTSGHEIIDKAKAKFINLKEVYGETPKVYVPRMKSELEASGVNYEQFLSLTHQRRSVRWYRFEKVPDEIIDKALEAANQSPSACNRQPFQFRIFNDPERLKSLVYLPSGTKGFAENIPNLVIVVGDLSAYRYEHDRHAIYIDASLAAMSFILALETLGISSCPLNWPDLKIREKKMARELTLKSWERPLFCISFGYPDPQGMVPHSVKKPLETIRRINS